MGRPRHDEDKARTARLSVRVRPAYREWVAKVATKAGDHDATALIERLLRDEAERVKAPPPPPR